MATDRIYFIAWDAPIGSLLSSRCDVYNNYYSGQTHHQRTWTPVFYDDPHPNGVISNMGGGLGNRLIVAGHGAPGDQNIYATEAGNHPLSYSDVVDRLVEHGFKKYYTGTVGCDVCHSAEGAIPFAKRLAKELHQRGFKLTNVIGYKGALLSGYQEGTLLSDGAQHKYRHRRVQLADGTFSKSSDAQVRFYGW